MLLLLRGVDGAGKGDTANLLHEWIDPRGIATCAYGAPSDEERERPEAWRYWRDLPSHGRIGIFLSAWYHAPLIDRVYGRIDDGEFARRLERIRDFERTVTDDGTLIVKLWMHLGRDEQKRRLRSLEGDPDLAWRVTEMDWRHWRMYDEFVSTAERILRGTDTDAAPWTILDGREKAWRNLRVGELLRDRIRAHLEKAAAEKAEKRRVAPTWKRERRGLVSSLDLGQRLEKSTYRKKLLSLQGRLNRLYRLARSEGIPTVLAFEGWDASGKGGAIRRVTAALDARGYRVNQIGAPSAEERAHHYLWRFWQYLPRAGDVTIFDRSWYGRVLVERIEGFATEAEWKRAYREINEFEAQLVDSGTVVVKFWMHICAEEQEKRFAARQKVPYKSWKLTEEDWRNRKRWREYEQAAEDMVELTGTDVAPWTLVEGNDKRFARVKVLRTVCEALERALGLPPAD